MRQSCLQLNVSDPAVIVLLVTCGFVAWVLVALNRYPNTRGHKWARLALYGCFFWLICPMFEASSHTAECARFWGEAAWPPIVVTISAWSFFIYEYATRKSVPLLVWVKCILITPVVVFVAASVSPSAEHFYTYVRPIQSGAERGYEFGHGAVFYFFMVFINAVLFASLFLAVRAALKAPVVVRRFVEKLLIATAFPWLGNAVYLTSDVTILGLDPTPMLISLSAGVVIWLMLDKRWMDMKSIGRDYLYLNSRDPILFITDEGKLLDANPDAKRVFHLEGLSGSQSVVNHPQLGTMVSQLGENGDDGDMRIIEAGGRKFAPRVNPLVLPHVGKRFGWLLTLMDVTAREEAAARTRAADLAKSQFLSTITHELRTPLTVIKGSVQLMSRIKDKGDVESFERLLTLAETNAETLSRLVNDLLAVQRFENSEEDMKFDRIVLDDLVKRVADRVKQERRSKTVTIETHLPDLPLAVEGEKQALEQVVENILSNSIKFSGDPVKIVVTLDSDEDNARIRVSDNGHGIPEGSEEQVFGMFTQLDSSDTRMGGGSGIGMHISRRIVQRHSGRLSYESVLGEGTTFTVTLPLAAK
ncbi:ATP-binding protein [Heliomarina baculiformis]|uniref:sensor histidine kinase n=1 Tax=Heliomarina baculiformis TaxID=2872036 RepID=UPI001EE2FA50|nr:ATP-binding protein [Heliomarina baculiformis]